MRRVPVEELVDVERLAEGGRRPTPKALREALPRGWVLDPGGETARRDLRVMAREGWIVLVGLVCFGAAGVGLFWATFPRGWGGVLRFVALVAIVLVAGGLVAPGVTRAVLRRGRSGTGTG